MTATQEFLWHFIGDEYRRRCKHRVIADLGPCFIVQSNCSPRIASLTEQWPDTVRVSQAWKANLNRGYWYTVPPPLRKKGYVPPPEIPWFEIPAYVPPRPGAPRIFHINLFSPAEDAKILGTPWPCSAAALKTAFRAKAKATHPDHGGTHEAFLKVRTAYDRLSKLTQEARP